MKTAISIPDPIFRSAELAARRLKMNRSQLYTAAVAEYVARRKDAGVTEKLNEVYADAGSKTPDTPRRVARGRRQRSLVALAGSGRGLWGKDSSKTLRGLRDEWARKRR